MELAHQGKCDNPSNIRDKKRSLLTSHNDERTAVAHADLQICPLPLLLPISVKNKQTKYVTFVIFLLREMLQRMLPNKFYRATSGNFIIINYLQLVRYRGIQGSTGNTQEQKGIQGNTREYRGIRRNTREYRGIHRNRRKYRGIEGNSFLSVSTSCNPIIVCPINGQHSSLTTADH